MVMDRIDLRGKPFYLGDEAVRWVEETLQGMTDKEKVGQLFCEILWDRPGSFFRGKNAGVYRADAEKGKNPLADCL